MDGNSNPNFKLEDNEKNMWKSLKEMFHNLVGFFEVNENINPNNIWSGNY
jgi:hypothetical protein